jgi:hypothetical protein
MASEEILLTPTAVGFWPTSGPEKYRFITNLSSLFLLDQKEHSHFPLLRVTITICIQNLTLAPRTTFFFFFFFQWLDSPLGA